MEEIRKLLLEELDQNVYQLVISNPKNKEDISKIKIRPLLQKEELIFQASIFRGNQVLHQNHKKEDMIEEILSWMEGFKQIEIDARNKKSTCLISKKGKITIKQSKVSSDYEERIQELSHNRKKKYLLPEGQAVPFLVDLGIQTKEGKIVQSKYDKFKQINRYLEFVEDILPRIETGKEIRIIDFGCGKAYLTFALYYYLTVLKEFKVHMIGLDLKEEVIKNCSNLAKQYGYEGLTFLKGDIGCYEGETQVDMVVTLHACDTATDYALQKAVKWNAKVIFSVPCCQHEVNGQIKSELLAPILRYGIIKERMSALITDAIRANILEQNGYETQILEFIDMEHTPKNLLIRAVKHEKMQRAGKNEIERLLEQFNIEPSITKLL